jgi:hypothetical protein
MDIFISYAHVNNQPVFGKGWVSCFVENLKREIWQLLGRSEYCSFWMDNLSLHANDAITPEIKRQLNDAKILLIMLSKGWLESGWCRDELEYFCETHNDINGRIFIVDIDGEPLDNRPKILRDFLGIHLYKRNDAGIVEKLGYPMPQEYDRIYFSRIVELAHQITFFIKRINNRYTSSNNDNITVYVSPVGDALYDQRIQLVSELKQYGISILPEQNRYNNDSNECLRKCSYFIQLLNEDFSFGLPFMLYDQAKHIGLHTFQWREKLIDHSKINNNQQRQLIEGDDVIACDFSEFMTFVRKKIITAKGTSEPIHDEKKPEDIIFLYTSPDDFDHAQHISKKLTNNGYGVILPHYKGDAKTINKNIKRAYELCNILLIIQWITPSEVVDTFLFEIQNHTCQTHKSLKILLCRNDHAEDLEFFHPKLELLNCNSDVFKDHCLIQFLEKIK